MDQTPTNPAPPPPLKSPSELTSPSIPQSTEQSQNPVQTQPHEPLPPSSSPPSAITPTTTVTTSPSPSLPPPPTTTTATQQPVTTTPPTPSLPPSIPSPVPEPPAPTSTPQPVQTPQPRALTGTPTPFSRPWQQQSPSTFTHFSLPPSPTPPLPSSTSSSSPSISTTSSVPPVQRGGMAIGVPAHHPNPPSPTTSFNPSPFGQQFGGLGRNVPDSIPSSSGSQIRQSVQGIGIMGSLGTSAAMRPAGVPGHLQRPVQSSIRPQSGLNPQSSTTQNFQGHGMLRGQSIGSSGSSSTNSTQSLQNQNQPWLSSAAQGKPPLPPLSVRPQINPQSMQQRAHIPQQQHTTSTTTQQHPASSSQVQQHSTLIQPQEQAGQHYSSPRPQPSMPHQQHMGRGQGLGIQRPTSLGVMQSGASHPAPPNRTSIEEAEEICNKILGKRTIQELVNQIDPSEKLELEVEDILVDIAEEFVDSITTFGCSLAKHRKSTVLESKDILLHVERNWNMTLPGFSADEIKTYKKPLTNDLHRERLAVIKKSTLASESPNPKSSGGQAGGNPKSHLAKGPAGTLGGPNF